MLKSSSWPRLTREQQEHAALLAAAARRPTTVIISHGRQHCLAVGLESGNFDPLLLLVLPLARQAGKATTTQQPPQLVHLHTFMSGVIRQHPAAFASVITQQASAADTPAVVTAQQLRRLCCSLLRVRERQQHEHKLQQQPRTLIGCSGGCSSSQGWSEFPTLQDYLAAVAERAGTAQLKGQQLWLHQPSLQPGAAVPCSAAAGGAPPASSDPAAGDPAQAAPPPQQQQQQKQQRRQCASCQVGLSGSWLACTIAQYNSVQGSYSVRFTAGPCQGETASVLPGLCTVHFGPEPPGCTHCLSASPARAAPAAAATAAAAEAQPSRKTQPPASSGEGARGRVQRQKRAAQGPPLPPRQQQQKRKKVVTEPQQPGQLVPVKLQQRGKQGQAAKQQALGGQLPPPPAAAEAAAVDAGGAAAGPSRAGAKGGARLLPLLLKPPLECSSADIAAALQLVRDALADGQQEGQPSLASALQARQDELGQQLWYSQLAHACVRDDVAAARMVLAELVD